MFPVPLFWPDAPPAKLAVHLTPVRFAGKELAAVAPCQGVGTLFFTTAEYPTGSPGVYDGGAVTTSETSESAVAWSVAELFVVPGSVTPPGAVPVAVLVRSPFALAVVVPTTVNV